MARRTVLRITDQKLTLGEVADHLARRDGRLTRDEVFLEFLREILQGHFAGLLTISVRKGPEEGPFRLQSVSYDRDWLLYLLFGRDFKSKVDRVGLNTILDWKIEDFAQIRGELEMLEIRKEDYHRWERDWVKRTKQHLPSFWGHEAQDHQEDQRNVFQAKNDRQWLLRFRGTESILDLNKPLDGMSYIRILLGCPHQRVSSLVLRTRDEEAAARGPLYSASSGRLAQEGLETEGMSSSGAPIDARARRKYKERAINLQSELDEAEARGNADEAAGIRNEMELLTDAVEESQNRRRESRDDLDKARVAVKNAINRALKKIDRVHPTLASHLHSSIKTGQSCVYSPPSGEGSDWAT